MGSNRLSDGFLLGAAVGAAAFFLLGTKKGNKILKVISEEGAEELSNFIKEIDKSKIGASPEPKTSPAKTSLDESVEEEEIEEVPLANGENSAQPKRFFKKKK